VQGFWLINLYFPALHINYLSAKGSKIF